MEELRSPLLVVVEVTGNCNLSCKYCYAECELKRTSDIEFAVIKKIIDEASELGVFDLNICGGEPLLHRDIRKIISYASTIGLEISLNTNATLVNNDIAELLLKYDVIKNTQVSFDSHIKAIHNKTRGGYSRALNGFLKLVEKADDGMEPIVGIVLNKYNIETVVDTVRFFSDYTKKFHIMNVMNNEKLEPTKEQWTHFHSHILPELRELPDVQVSRFMKNSGEYYLKNSHIDCLGGYTFIAVTSSLEIVPCDIARKPIHFFKDKGDLLKGYEKAKEMWKARTVEWCRS